MSLPRYDWWSYVKGMIRRYPALKSKYGELHKVGVVTDFSIAVHAGHARRNTESAAIRELPHTEQREFESVGRAIAMTERYRDGAQRMRVMDLVFWQKSHTVEGAGLAIPCGPATAKRWHGEFIRLVASYYGLIDK